MKQLGSYNIIRTIICIFKKIGNISQFSVNDSRFILGYLVGYNDIVYFFE